MGRKIFRTEEAGAKTTIFSHPYLKAIKGNQRQSKAEPRVLGGPNANFLKKYNLDKMIHPIYWLNSILPLFSFDNLENIKNIDVTNECKT